MHVVATAGHVDHGKSTLVRALTGTDPDRLAEEKRRGLTIDLGFAWTTTQSGESVAFVDVPGHERFLGNMLAGLGPAPTVLFVVAADSGWQAQSSDHRDAIAALGIDRGLLVITRADLAPERAEEVVEQARTELAGTYLADPRAVVVSAATGFGMDELRCALDELVASAPPARIDARVRMWVDRSFAVKGAGTVVTGTLGAGTLAVGDQLLVADTRVGVRGLESLGSQVERIGPTSRVAVNLRGVATEQVRRGDALLNGDWRRTDQCDVRLVSGEPLDHVPTHLVAHVGTAAVSVRLRPLGATHARLRWDRSLPLIVGDRVVLRDPGQRIVAGVQVLDPEPPELTRRGAAARRAEALAEVIDLADPTPQVVRRGAVRPTDLDALGFDTSTLPAQVRAVDQWWVSEPVWQRWRDQLRAQIAQATHRDPLAGGLSVGAVVDLLGLPAVALVEPLARDVELTVRDGRVAGAEDPLLQIEPQLAKLEQMLRERPFAAPTAEELDDLGLGARELAAAVRAGRLLRLADQVVLLPNAPALSMRTIASLEQPFSASQVRQALDSSRRVVIPLLELLDAKGWTRRVEDGLRIVRR